MRLHIICERDVGLFSLVQQVVSHLPWALGEGRVPVAYFGSQACYWTPRGYADRDTVWEYYFEPLVEDCSAAAIPHSVRDLIQKQFPRKDTVGYELEDGTFVSSNFGHHRRIRNKALQIPFELEDPGAHLRLQASRFVQAHVRARDYILEKVDAFYRRHLQGRPVIGVHIRGTDAASWREPRAFRVGSLRLQKFQRAVDDLLLTNPDSAVFVATDAESSLAFMRRQFGGRVVACDAFRHERGPKAGKGPTGLMMPAYIAGDRDRAARNGEEAVVDYLLLSRCMHLVHNGSSLARTVLLKEPGMPHTNTHQTPAPSWHRWLDLVTPW